MPKPPYVAASHRRSLDTHGETVALYNYQTNSTERVQTWDETASSPHNITARIAPRTTPRRASDVREGGDVEADYRVYVKDDASGIGSIRDGGGKGASVIDPDQDGVTNDGSDYRVLVAHDEDNGQVRLDVERID